MAHTVVPLYQSVPSYVILVFGSFICSGVHILVTPTPSTDLGVLFDVESRGDVRICDTRLETFQTR